MRPGGGRGDQFNVCDRFVVPALSPGQQRQIADGHLLLDQMTRNFMMSVFGVARLGSVPRLAGWAARWLR